MSTKAESEPVSEAASETPSESRGATASPQPGESPAPLGSGGSGADGDEPSVVTDLPVLHTAKRLKVEARRLDGLQRELYSLIGDGAAPVVVQPAPKFKTRPEWQQKAAPWVYAEFEPKPGLSLHHWVRKSTLVDGVSADRFARFNTPSNVPEWTDDNYRDWFASEDWTREETRYLFSLVKDYDLRWVVVADRYDFHGKQRSTDELKERYYEVASALIRNRPVVLELGLSPHDEELLAAMKFDRASEEKRKAHLERLLSRTPKEVAEEEALILEARRLESQAERMLAERQQLVSLLESPQALQPRASKGTQDIATSQGVGQLLQELQSEKSRKPVSSSAAAPSAVNGAAAVAGAPSTLQASRSAALAVIENATHKKLTPREETAIGISYVEAGKTKHPGVFLRSARLTPIRQSLLPRVRAVTAELGLPLRPVMPTARVCARYESLYHSITVLLEAKKVQDKLQMEIEVLRRATSNPAASSRSVSEDKADAAAAGTETPDPQNKEAASA